MTKSFGLELSLDNNLPCYLRDHDPGRSVHETNDGDNKEEHPPHPQDEEILLVEEIVGEDAQIVALIREAS